MTVSADITPDQDQRDLILTELGRSMLVEAAAGTGKTASMIGRMVELIRTGACPDIRCMAAVTFTRKAAAELRARFQLALEKAAAAESRDDERERLRLGLGSIEQCFVGTIHSFCARLLRERPVEAGVDISFEEIDEEADDLLRAAAWREYCATLFAADPHGTLAELGRFDIDPTGLEDAFNRFALYPDVERWPSPGPDRTLERVEETAAELFKYVEHMRALAGRLPSRWGNDRLIPRYRSIPRVVSHYDDLLDPRQLAALLETEFDQTGTVVLKQWAQDGEFTGEDAKREHERWEEFRNNFARPFLASWRELRYAAVMRALTEARDVYNTMRADLGRLNFQDLLMKAARLLRENPHVRRYFSARYTHLLVDEFQDTDPVQAEVMMLLTSGDPRQRDWRRCRPRPGSLFVVGDPKQSIFRFRRADIVTYDEVKGMVLSGEGEEKGLLVTLSTNFRTLPPLIDWVNSVFQPGADDTDGRGRPLRFPAEARQESPCYVPLVPGRASAEPGTLSGVFTVDIPEAVGNKEQAVPFEADLIARFIRSCLDSGATVARTPEQSRAGLRPQVDPSDFLIITRYRSNLSAYAAALQRYGIPHRVTGGAALNEVEELALLRAVLAAVTRADDPVALVGALRSEAFGLSDAALYRFKRAGGRFNYNHPLPDGLSEEDASAFADSFERLKRYHLWLSRLPAPSALERTAADLGLFVLAGSREGGEIQAGSLAKALELLRAAYRDEWSTARLVDYLGQLVERRQKYDGVSARSTEVPSVRVMNLHKVKGLEAPVVFLADAYGEGRHEVEIYVDRSGGEVLGYMSIPAARGNHPLAHPEGWEAFGEREAAFRSAEELRLRYVAATRAGCALYVTQRAAGRQNTHNAWRHFLPLLPPGSRLEDPGPRSAPAADEIEIIPGEAASAASDITFRLELVTEPTYEVHRAKEYALSAGARPVPEAPSPAARPGRPAAAGPTHGLEWGDLVHRLLEVAMKQPDADLVSWAQSFIDEDELEAEWAEPAARAVRKVMGSRLWKRAARAPQVLTEVPFHVRLDDGCPVPRLFRGAVDLAFREQSGWVLVDYKTDSVASKADLGRLVDKYAPQIELYAKAWRLCTGAEVSEAGFFFTSSGQYMEVQL